MNITRVHCARCDVVFEVETANGFPIHYLCGVNENNCYEEAAQFEETNDIKQWKAFVILVNGDWADEQLEDMANSAAVSRFVLELLRHKEHKTLVNLLRKLQ